MSAENQSSSISMYLPMHKRICCKAIMGELSTEQEKVQDEKLSKWVFKLDDADDSSGSSITDENAVISDYPSN
jgi:hypothetical protein